MNLTIGGLFEWSFWFSSGDCDLKIFTLISKISFRHFSGSQSYVFLSSWVLWALHVGDFITFGWDLLQVYH